MAFRWSSESVVVDHKDLKANTMAIDYSGKYVILAGRRTVAIIDMERPLEVVKRMTRSQQKYDVMAADWNPTSHMGHSFALAVGEKAEIFQWDNGLLSTETTLKAHTRTVSDLHWHRTEPYCLVTCSIDTFLHIWDIRETKKPVISLSAIAGSSRVKWNKINANYLASGHGSDMRIWDRRKSNQPLCYINAHLQKIHGLDWSPNHENKIVSSSSDSTVKFFDIENPRMSDMQISLQSPVWRARYTPFGEGIVTVVVPPLRRGDNSLLLWSLSDLSNPVHTFVGHSDVVLEFDWRIVDANMSEVQLVTLSRDNSLRIWRLDPQILKLCGHSFDDEDDAVAEEVEVESSDTDTLLGSLPCPDEVMKNGAPESDGKVKIDISPANEFPLPISTSLSDRLRREPPKTLALNRGNLQEEPSQSPDFISTVQTPSIKLPDSSVYSPSLPPSTPSGGHIALSITAELNALCLCFEKTAETSVEIVKKEESKQCLVNVLHGSSVALLEITLPSNYPRSQSPSFRFGSGSSIEATVKKELLKILKTTAAQYLKKRRNCIEHCIMMFVTRLKSLLTEERNHVNDKNMGSSGMINSNYFSLIYGGEQDYRIPFSRTSGARFGSSGILVCFTRPSQRNSCSRSARAEPSTPRSLCVLSAYISKAYPQIPTNGGTSNSKYSTFKYSGQNSSMDNPGSTMYFNQEHLRSNKRKSDVESSKFSKTAMITIYDISKLIPISRELAKDYEYHFNETDIIGCCHKNRDTALEHGRKDIAQTWSLAASILSVEHDYGNKEGHPWTHNPLVRNLTSSMINNYLSKHDVQTAAMLSCILGKRPKNVHPQAVKKSKAIDPSPSVSNAE